LPKPRVPDLDRLRSAATVLEFAAPKPVVVNVIEFEPRTRSATCILEFLRPKVSMATVLEFGPKSPEIVNVVEYGPSPFASALRPMVRMGTPRVAPVKSPEPNAPPPTRFVQRIVDAPPSTIQNVAELRQAPPPLATVLEFEPKRAPVPTVLEFAPPPSTVLEFAPPTPTVLEFEPKSLVSAVRPVGYSLVASPPADPTPFVSAVAFQRPFVVHAEPPRFGRAIGLTDAMSSYLPAHPLDGGSR
jgi:hypothetical protein